MAPSERLFKHKCRSCHALPKPDSRSAEEWPKIITKHESRVKLTDEQKELILKHLTGASKSPKVETD